MKKRRPAQARPVWKSVLLGGILSLLIAAMLSMLFALLILNGVIPPDAIPYLSKLCCAIGVFTAAGLLCGKDQAHKYLLALGTAAFFFTAMECMQLLLPQSSGASIWITAAVCLLCGLAAAVCTRGKGKRRIAKVSNVYPRKT